MTGRVRAPVDCALKVLHLGESLPTAKGRALGMSERQAPIQLSDIDRLVDAEAPDLVETILAFARQPEQLDDTPRPESFVSQQALRQQLAEAARAYDKDGRREGARQAWSRYLEQPAEHLAPQLQLASRIERLYETKTGSARLALLALVRSAPLTHGLWGGLKRVYKRAEEEHDAELFGAFAARFERASTETDAGDVKRGTLVYLQRRSRRFLRLLGKALPEMYPQFAVEVLRSCAQRGAIVAFIEEHDAKKWGAPGRLPKDKKFRATYLDAWKRSPDPLLLLLETAQADFAAQFAILGLRELFPEALRKLTPAFLARLAFRPLESVHLFVTETLAALPEFHQGKLKGLGLHEAVLSLLTSPAPAARRYAIEYARSHASDLPVTTLLELLTHERFTDLAEFASQLLEGRGAKTLGVAVLGRLVGFAKTHAWAKRALDEQTDKSAISESFLADMLYSRNTRRAGWAQAYLDKLGAKTLPVAFWMRLVDDVRHDDEPHIALWAVEVLRKHVPIQNLPGDWLLGTLSRPERTRARVAAAIGEWLGKAEALPRGLDLERLKGLVVHRAFRTTALSLLGNQKLIAPAELGLGWLLALARRADPQLHEWAHRYLLQHMKPAHFAQGKRGGVERLFELALGAGEPEAVRAFAQTYLRCHHPKIGSEQAESQQFGIRSEIARDEYSQERLWDALFELRGDVRRFAATLTRVELRRWGAQTRVYELAESSAKEVRSIAYDALEQVGTRHADPDLALLPEELDAAQIFSMTESRIRASRNVAIELIRKHYARIGGAERLGWLMQSADREVRFFAVRLLWERHRPRGVPSDWRPSGLAATTALRAPEHAGAFEDAKALRDLLRRLLLTLPPGRSMEALEGERTKKQSASVAKRNLVEIVRDLALTDGSFAALVAPVLEEQTGSRAKGEWHACLSALVSLRSAHGWDHGGPRPDGRTG